MAAFSERGLGVSVKEIARRAGVSHGTVYNLFGDKEALVDAVVSDLVAARLAAAVDGALAIDDPWDGFAWYVETLCEAMATDLVMADAISGRVSGTSRVAQICEQAHAGGSMVLERARNAGGLRDDFVATDLLFVFGAQAALAPAAEAVVPGSWRRGVAFMLDGLRSSSQRSRPAPALTVMQMSEVNARLGGTVPRPSD